jgi:3-hydroxyisobutyrate dehydrogenase-like beta-hydroxyacid dehydrogenase
MSEEVVGFVGLGAMGGPMAANLVRAGFEVVGFDTSADRLREAERTGVRRAASVAELVHAATRTVISVVRDAEQTRAVLAAPDGLLSAGRAPIDLVVMSTLDPSTMARLAEEVAGRGISAVDAPVSGGVAGAREATLTIMMSGDAATLERVRPALGAMGEHLHTVGPRPGMAQAAKLANQLMLAVTMLGVSEGLRLATANGVDEEALMRLLATSTGGSWTVKNWSTVRRFWERHVPGGELDIICKDLRSALREADQREISVPVTAVAFQRIRHTWERPGPRDG